MFKCHIGRLPDVFVSFFTCNRNIHQYATRQSHQLHYPKFKTELGKRSLAFWGVKIWNTILKTDIRSRTTDIQNTLKKIVVE